MNKTQGTGIALAVAFLCSCSGVPSYVIEPEEMAPLLADMRMATSVVESNPAIYGNDSSRLALKETVLRHHRVSQADFDTSLVWYGHHIDKYQQVNELTQQVLEERLRRVNALAAGEAAISVSGDSVDLWERAPIALFDSNSPSNYLTFTLETDKNWEKGDIYTLLMRPVLPLQKGQWGLSAQYADGTVETLTATFMTSEQRRQALSLVTDSTRTATRISGWINIKPTPGRPALLDSIALTRRHPTPGTTPTRNYMQKQISPNDHR